MDLEVDIALSSDGSISPLHAATRPGHGSVPKFIKRAGIAHKHTLGQHICAWRPAGTGLPYPGGRASFDKLLARTFSLTVVKTGSSAPRGPKVYDNAQSRRGPTATAHRSKVSRSLRYLGLGTEKGVEVGLTKGLVFL